MNARGFSLVEVLVTIAILSVGLLGLAGLQAHGLMAQKEAYQRAQALALLKDMAGRIQSNRTDAKAGSYVASGANTRGTGYNASTAMSCSGLGQVNFDLCQWHNALLGASSSVATLAGARGCIETFTAPNTVAAYRISVAWQGYVVTATPAVGCGAGSYGTNEARRRVVTMNVTVPTL